MVASLTSCLGRANGNLWLPRPLANVSSQPPMRSPIKVYMSFFNYFPWPPVIRGP